MIHQTLQSAEITAEIIIVVIFTIDSYMAIYVYTKDNTHTDRGDDYRQNVQNRFS